MSTDSDRRDELHNALDGLISELGPGEYPFGLGVSVSCGDERLVYGWVNGEIRKAVLTDPHAVADAFDAGSLDLASGDVTT